MIETDEALSAEWDAGFKAGAEAMRDLPREVAMGHGMQEVCVVNHEGRHGLRIFDRGFYVPVGDETAPVGALVPCNTKGGILVWFDGPEFGDTIVNAINEAAAVRAMPLPAPPSDEVKL